MTREFRPNWDDEKPEVEKPVNTKSMDEEYAKLRELRNECLVEAPIKLNQLAEGVRAGRPFNDLANELQAYGLRLKRLAEEAR